MTVRTVAVLQRAQRRLGQGLEHLSDLHSGVDVDRNGAIGLQRAADLQEQLDPARYTIGRHYGEPWIFVCLRLRRDRLGRPDNPFRT